MYHGMGQVKILFQWPAVDIYSVIIGLIRCQNVDFFVEVQTLRTAKP